MPTLHAQEIRRSKRIVAKTGASVVIDLASRAKRIPCLIVNRSPEGFRVRLSARVRRGQLVEVIPQDDPLLTIRCTVVWIGKVGSKQEGEIGLQVQLIH